MINKVDITVCLGSSCFSRGNRDLVTYTQDYIEKHQLHDRVNFKGGHCFSACNKGPAVVINGVQHYALTQESLAVLLDESFNM